MKIQFNLRFSTRFGQSLSVTGNIKALGNYDITNAFRLTYVNNHLWSGEVEVDPAETVKIHYQYIFFREDGTSVLEWDDRKQIDISKTGVDEIRLIDSWCDASSVENTFYTDPFQEVLLAGNRTNGKGKSAKVFTHIFKVKSPLLQKNEILSVTGDSVPLGDWDPRASVPMTCEEGWWTTKINLPDNDSAIAYKFLVYDSKAKIPVRFESGENRFLFPNEKKITIIHDGFARLTNSAWKGAGVSVPVFSLRSKNSFGVGEFPDIKLLVDWAKRSGLKLIQILPVNDTTATHTWVDSYPYASISAFALHPIYLNLDEVAGKKHADVVKSLKKKQKQLNELTDLDYEQVTKFKLSTLKELFVLQKQEFLKDDAYLEFFKQNRHWLIPYAAFCYLRDRNGTSNYNDWKLYSKYDKEGIEKYVSPKAKHYDNIALHYFIQYHLHKQLQEAAEYANKNGIILKGDIPIGIYRFGCDAWEEPELFHFDVQAGAPPDDFAVKGQNWGFPTYNWERMADDHFEWWHQRFVQMSNYFDAFRIDHILGFFRIWSIPIHAVEGLMGYFIPAIPVHIHEFSQNNIWFNYHRYCKPYINDAVLWEMFGPNNEKFKAYLNPVGNHFYELKDDFSTQARVATHFSKLGLNEENKNLQQGLYDLITNVILFEHPGSNGQQFHFRISMEKSLSFRHLDPMIQGQLTELYINYFYRRQEGFWKDEGFKKLSPLKRSTNMLVCGEDLGMVPHCVPEIMKELGILSLEIQRMPKDLRATFFNPSNAPYLSVVTPSTHDMSTIRGWWEEDRETIQNFYNTVLDEMGDAPATCEPWINKAIVQQHLDSPAMWSIFQLQDLLGMTEGLRRPNANEERINVPANSKHYWKYRMHLPLETLVKEKEFNDELRSMVEESGR